MSIKVFHLNSQDCPRTTDTCLGELGDPRIRKIFQYDAMGRVTGFIERRESWDIVWKKVD
jgi:hypothetical protein